MINKSKIKHEYIMNVQREGLDVKVNKIQLKRKKLVFN